MPGELGVAAPGRVDVLGALEVVAADGTRSPVPGRQQRTLLSLLVLHRDRPVPPARLVAGLWGDAAPPGAEVTLRSHVSHLRRLLTELGLGQRLEAGPGGYRLDLPRSSVDVDRFEELVGSGQEALALGDTPRAAAHLHEALRLWRGRPYPDLDEVDDVEPEVIRLDGLRLTAVEAGVDADLATGRHREVVGELESLVTTHPFHERFCAQLMVALYRSGRQADALEVYSGARERLAEELGLDPGPELQELYRKVLRQDPELLGGASTPAPPGPDRNQPPEVNHPPDAVFSTLTRFPVVGRSTELARLDAAWQDVADGGRGVLLVSGPAGIGKTHLVAALAERVAEGGRPRPGRPLRGHAAAGSTRWPAHSPAPARCSDCSRRTQRALPSVVTALLGMPSTGSREPAEAGPDTSEELVATGVATVLRQLAVSGPVLLVLDDVDRVNTSSAVLLGHLVERLPAGVLVVLAYRDPPGARHPPLLGLLGEVASRAVAERIVLGPLTEEDLADLVRDRTRRPRGRRAPRPPPVGAHRWKPLLRGRAGLGRRNG